LIATNQTEFTITAAPTRLGRKRKTREMDELSVCDCGIAVEEEARVLASTIAVRCGFDGCETGWVCRCSYGLLADIADGGSHSFIEIVLIPRLVYEVGVVRTIWRSAHVGR